MSAPTRADCVGNSSDFNTWSSVWKQSYPNSCYHTYHQFIFNQSGGGFDQANLKQANTDFQQIFNNYVGKFNKQITLPGRAGYDEVQENLLAACQKLPACDKAMRQQSQGFDRNTIANNRAYVDFFGCYSPPPALDAAAKILANDKQCDPLCNRVSTIQLWETTDPKNQFYGNQIECQRAVCVIDNITIDAIKSTTGDINFDQVCSACSNASGNVGCTCIISGVDINNIWSEIGGVNFNQQCGGAGSLCLEISDNGTDTPVECSKAIDDSSGSKVSTEVLVIIGIILVVIIIIIFIYVFYKK